MDLGDSNWFLGVPVIIIIILNIVFLSKVLIIQRAKLRENTVTAASTGGTSSASSHTSYETDSHTAMVSASCLAQLSGPVSMFTNVGQLGW